MYPAVQRAIDSICLSRDEDGWQSLDEDALAALVEEFGERDLADRLYEEIPRTVPFEIVCDLFDLLAWRTNDNRASVTRTAERWLREGIDNRKVLIALNLEVYPFIDPVEMDEVLSKLATNNSKVSARCRQMIKNRKNEERNAVKCNVSLFNRLWSRWLN